MGLNPIIRGFNDGGIVQPFMLTQSIHDLLESETIEQIRSALPFCNMNEKKDGQTPLTWALVNQRLDIAESLIHSGADLRILNEEGFSALHLAASSGNDAILKLLQERGADLECPDSYGNLAHHHAAMANQTTTLRLLLRANPRLINARSPDGSTALHLAAQHGANRAVAALLLNKDVDAEAKDVAANAAHHLAAIEGHSVALGLLLQANSALINSPGKNQLTALHFAALHGHHTTVAFLLKQEGIDMHAKDVDGNMPHHLAAFHGYTEILNLFLKKDPTLINIPGGCLSTALHYAVGQGREETVAFLLEQPEVDLTAKDADGNAPHHHGVFEGKISTLRIVFGAYPELINIRGGKEYTALHFAARFGREDILEFVLKQKGIDLVAKDKSGSTALHVAIANGKTINVKALLERTSRLINIQDNHGRSPLYLAAERGCEDIVKLLLKTKGVKPGLKTSTHNTALHIAIHKKNLSIVKWLAMCCTGLVNVEGSNGFTSLHLAVVVNNGSFEILMERAKAIKLGLKNAKQLTALQLAILMNNMQMAGTLFERSHFSEAEVSSLIDELLEVQSNKRTEFLERFTQFLCDYGYSVLATRVVQAIKEEKIRNPWLTKVAIRQAFRDYFNAALETANSIENKAFRNHAIESVLKRQAQKGFFEEAIQNYRASSLPSLIKSRGLSDIARTQAKLGYPLPAVLALASEYSSYYSQWATRDIKNQYFDLK